MARIVGGPEITGQVTNTTTGAPYGGVTVNVTPQVYTDPEMTIPVSSLTANGQGMFSCYATPGNYTFTTPAVGAAPIEPVEVLGIEQGLGTHVGAGVASFNTRTGAVTLSKADVTGTGLASGDVSAAAAVHTHAEADTTNLVSDLAGKASAANLTAHTSNTSNPHVTTAAQVSAPNYVNHGATASAGRPAGATVVLWAGSVLPTNAVSADLLVDTTSLTLKRFNGTTWDILAPVASFNTRTGAITLTKADVTGTGLAAADVGAASASHTHPESDTTNLVTDLAAKQVAFTPGGYQGDQLVGSTSAPLITAASPPRGLAPVRYGQVLTVGAAAAFDAALVESPAIFWDPGVQKFGMVYTGYTQASGNNGGTASAVAGSIGLAYSRDLITWTKSGQILAASGSGVDSAGCTGPVMVIEGGTYYLFYIGLTATGYEGGTPTLCLATATSANGTYTRRGQIVGTSSAGTGWRSSKVYHASIVKKGSTYYAFINALGTVTAVSKERIGYATATSLLGPWTCDDTNSPLVNVGGSGAWDEGLAGDPSVYRIGDTWYMAYYGANAALTAASDGVAYTTDANFPLSWTKHASNPLLSPGPAGNFDSKYAHKPYIWISGRDCYHFYTADDGTHRSIGLAVDSPSAPKPSFVGSAQRAINIYQNANNISVPKATSMGDMVVWTTFAALNPQIEVTLNNVVAGQMILIGCSFAASNEATDGRLTFATVNGPGGAVITEYNGGTNHGVLAWWMPASVFSAHGGTVPYTLVAADIVNGSVTLRLRGMSGSATVEHKIFTAAADQLVFWAST